MGSMKPLVRRRSTSTSRLTSARCSSLRVLKNRFANRRSRRARPRFHRSNSLRRMLLSSLEGAAITSIRIDGVLHEFSTIPGVRDDVTNIVLNLKQLCLKMEGNEPKVIRIDAEGEKEVTAADIVCDADIEVLNPDLHIATLNEDGKLKIEMTVERGRGYVSAVQNKDPEAEIGRIPVDSIYSPVLKVTYKVEATRVEQRTDFDKLIIDVETKPAIRPRDAIASAGNLNSPDSRSGPLMVGGSSSEVDEGSVDTMSELPSRSRSASTPSPADCAGKGSDAVGFAADGAGT
mgnify:CR=1 FL=1